MRLSLSGSKIAEMSEFERELVLDFYELQAELEKMKAVATASEAHGIICGQLAGGIQLDGIMWLQQFLMGLGIKNEPSQGTQKWFLQLYKYCLEELNETEITFQPLLPDDQDDLNQRLEEIGSWCSGFLAGFGSTGERDERTFSEEIQDVFRDLAAITQVDTEIQGEADEEEEIAYTELLEFVRVAVLMIFMEFGLKRDDADSDLDQGLGFDQGYDGQNGYGPDDDEYDEFNDSDSNTLH